MNGGGYDVSPQPLAKGIHATTVVGYVDDCAPTLSTLASEAKTGGGMLTGSVKALCKILAPMGKKALATVATLLALNQVGKTQKGGGLVDGLASKLLPMSKTNLLVLVSLLLLNYFMHLQKKSTKKQRGGGMGAQTLPHALLRHAGASGPGQCRGTASNHCGLQHRIFRFQ